MTRKNSLLARLSGGLSLAVLAAAFCFGGPTALRAADEEVLTPALQELVVAPIMKAVEGLEQRLMRLEASAGAWADSLMTRRAVVHEICLADDSGAQTCITKGQLDALIRNVARADVAEPADSTTQANIAPAAEPVVAPAAEPVVVALPPDPISIPETGSNSPQAAETVIIVVPTESISIPVTEPNAPVVAEPVVITVPSAISVPETEASAPPAAEPSVPPAAEPAAIAAPAETVPVTPIALPADSAQEAEQLDHTGTIAPEAPAAPAAPLAQAPAADLTITAEAPDDE